MPLHPSFAFKLLPAAKAKFTYLNLIDWLLFSGGPALAMHPLPPSSSSRAPPVPPLRGKESTLAVSSAGGSGGATTVTHQDVNGVPVTNTVNLKDIDVQMTALSGYETYV